MYPVTEQWKSDNDLALRNLSYIRIVFGVTDPDALSLSNPVDNGHLSYSDTASVDLGTTAPATYQTLERNRFVLDGVNPLPSKTNPIYQGYAGYLISDENCMWTINPKITITFDDYVQFPGLTFQFDESKSEYPSEFQIIAYYDNTEVFNQTVYPDTAYWSYMEPIPINNKLELIWKKSNLPHRRARLTSLIYGLVNTLTTEDVVSCSSNKEIDLLSSAIPKQEFEFTFIDTQQMYDPENPDSLWEYLESRQPVTYYYGYLLSTGTIEWIPWGVSYSTGDFSVTEQGRVANVTIKCVGLADHLNTNYDEGVYSEEGKSLFDLAMEVMEFAGFEDTIQLDDALKNIVTHNPMPTQSVNKCLQLIANAGRCIMSHSRGGYITILKENNVSTGFEMDFKHMTDTPQTSKIAPLRNLTISYTHTTLESTTSNAVQDVEITDAVNKEYIFTHSGYANLSLKATGCTVVGTPQYYAYKTVAVLNGTGTITITGNRIIENTIEVSKKYSDVGEDLSGVTNKLIDNQADAEAYADWVAEVTLRRNSYSAPDRGYPEVDVGDSVVFTSNFQNQIPVTVTKQKLTFNGAIKGECEYIIGNEDDTNANMDNTSNGSITG